MSTGTSAPAPIVEASQGVSGESYESCRNSRIGSGSTTNPTGIETAAPLIWPDLSRSAVRKRLARLRAVHGGPQLFNVRELLELQIERVICIDDSERVFEVPL